MTPLRRIGLYSAVVLANAAVQAALIAVAPLQPLDPAAIALASVSGLALLAASVALWWIAAGRLTRRLVLLAVASGVLVALLAVAAPYVIPLVVGASCPVLAAGGFTGAIALARRRAWQFAGMLILTIVAALLATLLALLLGLFVTGALAAATAWILIGAGAAALVHVWNAVATRPAAAGRTQP